MKTLLLILSLAFCAICIAGPAGPVYTDNKNILGAAGSDLFAPADGDYLVPGDGSNHDNEINSGFPDDVSDPLAPAKRRPGRREDKSKNKMQKLVKLENVSK